MTPEQLNDKLDQFQVALPHETEWVEFKHNHSDPQMIGEYLSGISSNAAALCEQPFGYIVWGIEDGTHNIVGTSVQASPAKGTGQRRPGAVAKQSTGSENRLSHLRSSMPIHGIPIVLFEVQAANTAPVAVFQSSVCSCRQPQETSECTPRKRTKTVGNRLRSRCRLVG